MKNIVAQFSCAVTVNLRPGKVSHTQLKSSFFYDAADIAVALTSMRGTGIHS